MGKSVKSARFVVLGDGRRREMYDVVVVVVVASHGAPEQCFA